MDLAGHDRFKSSGRRADPPDACLRIGEALLGAAWAALASARVESVDIHLRSGSDIRGVIAVRIDGAIAEASVRAGQWTHAFGVEDVVLVRHTPRGGRRGECG